MPSFPDFVDPARATLDAFSGEVLSYEAAGELVAGGSVLGEAVAATEVAAAAAVLAEPLLVVGAGLAAAAAAEAILNKIAPTAPKPQLRTMPYSGGRVGGNVFVEFKFKLKNFPESNQSYTGNTPFQGVGFQERDGGQVTWGLIFGGVLVGAFQALPTQIDEPLTITNVTPNGGDPTTGKKLAPDWISPGTGALPVPTPVDIAYPGGGTVTITPTVYPSRKNQPDQQPNQPTSPGILVLVPEIGIAVNFSPNNVTIVYVNPSDSTAVQAPPRSPIAPIKYPTSECPCPEADNTELLCRIKAIQDGVLDDGYQYTSTTKGSGDSATVTGLTDEVVYVKLQVALPSLGAKTQYGNSHAPRVVYSGWLSWIVDGYQAPRQPIDYDNQVFVAPPLATGYSFTVTYGGTAQHTVVTRVKKPYVNHC